MSEQPTILVVEDNPTEQRLLTLLLERLGCCVLVVGDGASAVDVMSTHGREIDVILMDWQLDDMDGLACTRHIRELEERTHSYTPIIAVTARVLLGDRQKCLQSGMDDYLSKPFTADQFESMITKWLRRNASMTG